MSEGEQKVYDTLNEIGIEYEKYTHKPVYTVEDVNSLDIHIPGDHTKNLFLRNRKGNVHYLVVLEDSKQADLKKLSKQIGSTPLSFASEKRLGKYLGLKPGSVSPFGLINDDDKCVRAIIDNDIFKAERVGFHPNVNTATLVISTRDFQKFLKWTKNRISYMKI
ncbi:prolyl-tRNA synthetase associated domain-containing protein [Clostridium sp. MT-14]|uniref:Prolyl-tRNA synthetase associated domain-containing protein n=1 Tax=Clostridium aromativorans TaxID=2836848 RepID=A0ABS8NBY0_9CLOT|nr:MULTISPECIES: prolyl-tRNA synthetase associated domain-containing protein [Clostridium]MCC9296600.1 prolyl-tRNA synthetase associated domain-containing protein [Clostridium aromativorans]